MRESIRQQAMSSSSASLPSPQLPGLKALPCTPTTLTPLPSPLPTDVRQTQRRGRALRPPATPCRQRQHHYRKRKGHHLQRFRGHPGLQAEREVEERAEEERAGDRPQGIPGEKMAMAMAI